MEEKKKDSGWAFFFAVVKHEQKCVGKKIKSKWRIDRGIVTIDISIDIFV